MRPWSNVNLASNYRTYSTIARSEIEIRSGVHGAMIGEGHCIHTKLCCLIQQVVDTAEAVEQTKFAVNVEVREACQDVDSSRCC
jgi:hypothetical protein